MFSTLDSDASLVQALLQPGRSHSDSRAWLELTERSYRRALAASRHTATRDNTRATDEEQRQEESKTQTPVSPLSPGVAARPAAAASLANELGRSPTSIERASYEVDQAPVTHSRASSVASAQSNASTHLRGRARSPKLLAQQLDEAALRAHAAAAAKRSLGFAHFASHARSASSQLSLGQRMLLSARSASSSSLGSRSSSHFGSRRSSVSPSRHSSAGANDRKASTPYSKEPWYIKSLQRLHKEFRALSREAQVALTREQVLNLASRRYKWFELNRIYLSGFSYRGWTADTEGHVWSKLGRFFTAKEQRIRQEEMRRERRDLQAQIQRERNLALAGTGTGGSRSVSRSSSRLSSGSDGRSHVVFTPNGTRVLIGEGELPPSYSPSLMVPSGYRPQAPLAGVDARWITANGSADSVAAFKALRSGLQGRSMLMDASIQAPSRNIAATSYVLDRPNGPASRQAAPSSSPSRRRHPGLATEKHKLQPQQVRPHPPSKQSPARGGSNGSRGPSRREQPSPTRDTHAGGHSSKAPEANAKAATQPLPGHSLVRPHYTSFGTLLGGRPTVDKRPIHYRDRSVGERKQRDDEGSLVPPSGSIRTRSWRARERLPLATTDKQSRQSRSPSRQLNDAKIQSSSSCASSLKKPAGAALPTNTSKQDRTATTEATKDSISGTGVANPSRSTSKKKKLSTGPIVPTTMWDPQANIQSVKSNHAPSASGASSSQKKKKERAWVADHLTPAVKDSARSASDDEQSAGSSARSMEADELPWPSMPSTGSAPSKTATIASRSPTHSPVRAPPSSSAIIPAPAPAATPIRSPASPKSPTRVSGLDASRSLRRLQREAKARAQAQADERMQEEQQADPSVERADSMPRPVPVQVSPPTIDPSPAVPISSLLHADLASLSLAALEQMKAQLAELLSRSAAPHSNLPPAAVTATPVAVGDTSLLDQPSAGKFSVDQPSVGPSLIDGCAPLPTIIGDAGADTCVDGSGAAADMEKQASGVEDSAVEVNEESNRSAAATAVVPQSVGATPAGASLSTVTAATSATAVTPSAADRDVRKLSDGDDSNFLLRERMVLLQEVVKLLQQKKDLEESISARRWEDQARDANSNRARQDEEQLYDPSVTATAHDECLTPPSIIGPAVEPADAKGAGTPAVADSHRPSTSRKASSDGYSNSFDDALDPSSGPTTHRSVGSTSGEEKENVAATESGHDGSADELPDGQYELQRKVPAGVQDGEEPLRARNRAPSVDSTTEYDASPRSSSQRYLELQLDLESTPENIRFTNDGREIVDMGANSMMTGDDDEDSESDSFRERDTEYVNEADRLLVVNPSHSSASVAERRWSTLQLAAFASEPLEDIPEGNEYPSAFPSARLHTARGEEEEEEDGDRNRRRDAGCQTIEHTSKQRKTVWMSLKDVFEAEEKERAGTKPRVRSALKRTKGAPSATAPGPTTQAVQVASSPLPPSAIDFASDSPIPATPFDIRTEPNATAAPPLRLDLPMAVGDDDDASLEDQPVLLLTPEIADSTCRSTLASVPDDDHSRFTSRTEASQLDVASPHASSSSAMASHLAAVSAYFNSPPPQLSNLESDIHALLQYFSSDACHLFDGGEDTFGEGQLLVSQAEIKDLLVQCASLRSCLNYCRELNTDVVEWNQHHRHLPLYRPRKMNSLQELKVNIDHLKQKATKEKVKIYAYLNNLEDILLLSPTTTGNAHAAGSTTREWNTRRSSYSSVWQQQQQQQESKAQSPVKEVHVPVISPLGVFSPLGHMAETPSGASRGGGAGGIVGAFGFKLGLPPSSSSDGAQQQQMFSPESVDRLYDEAASGHETLALLHHLEKTGKVNVKGFSADGSPWVKQQQQQQQQQSNESEFSSRLPGEHSRETSMASVVSAALSRAHSLSSLHGLTRSQLLGDPHQHQRYLFHHVTYLAHHLRNTHKLQQLHRHALSSQLARFLRAHPELFHRHATHELHLTKADILALIEAGRGDQQDSATIQAQEMQQEEQHQQQLSQLASQILQGEHKHATSPIAASGMKSPQAINSYASTLASPFDSEPTASPATAPLPTQHFTPAPSRTLDILHTLHAAGRQFERLADLIPEVANVRAQMRV